MKENKIAIIITGIMSIVTIISAFICYGQLGPNSLAGGISLALFGSAMVSLFIAITNYLARRKEAMEEFLQETDTLLFQYSNITHLCFSQPIKLVNACLFAELDNTNQSRESTIREAKDNLKRWFNENGKNECERNLDGEGWDVLYGVLSASYIRSLKESIESYDVFSKNKMRTLNDAYAKMDFLFANKRIRNRIHKEVYVRLYDLLQRSKQLMGLLDKEKLNESYFRECTISIERMESDYLIQNNAQSFEELVEKMNKEIAIFHSKINR